MIKYTISAGKCMMRQSQINCSSEALGLHTNTGWGGGKGGREVSVCLHSKKRTNVTNSEIIGKVSHSLYSIKAKPLTVIFVEAGIVSSKS